MNEWMNEWMNVIFHSTCILLEAVQSVEQVEEQQFIANISIMAWAQQKFVDTIAF